MAKNPQSPRRSSRRAFSLIEMIVTSLLVGVIVIGVVPLFTRAVSNNIYGADASQLSAFLRSGTERVQQVSANDAAMGADNNPGGALDSSGNNPSNTATDPLDYIFSDSKAIRSVPLYYDSGARDFATKADAVIGDESWKPQSATPTGLFLWRQRREIREFSVADIFRGNISVGSSSGTNTLSPLGNPKLFDTPQVVTGLADIREIRMIVESTKGGIDGNTAATPSGIKQKASVNTYRAF